MRSKLGEALEIAFISDSLEQCEDLDNQGEEKAYRMGLSASTWFGERIFI